MKTHGEMTLENNKLFPYIAWAVLILFALFVGKLAMQLNDVSNELAKSTRYTNTIVQDNSERLDALEEAVYGTNPDEIEEIVEVE